jgi:hypothetical protein
MMRAIDPKALPASTLADFNQILRKMENISEKEIRGETLSELEQGEISQVALLLKSVGTFPEKVAKELALGAGDRMALVTDVHTDNNSRMVLEEAIGPPFVLQVRFGRKEGGIVFKGAVFSYSSSRRRQAGR